LRRYIVVSNTDDIMDLLREGNMRRKTVGQCRFDR
jgi:hypothetical protein